MSKNRRKPRQKHKPREFETFERHGEDVQIEPVDANNRANSRIRRLSPAESWWKDGKITENQYNAACRFQNDYANSSMTPSYAQSSWHTERVDEGLTDLEGSMLRQTTAGNCYVAAYEAIPQRCRYAAKKILAEEQAIRSIAPGGVQAAEVRTLVLVALDALVEHYAR